MWAHPQGFEPDGGLATIEERTLREAVRHLASPELAGRGTGAGGDRMAAEYVAEAFRLAGLVPGGDDGGYLQRFTVSQDQATHNAIGILEGSDLRGETVVIGAHLDHLGKAAQGYYPGADDNASGTAAVMELAAAFAAVRGRLRRSVVFVAFSAEEKGLLGSYHYVAQPARPMESTRFMLNLDMVGHLETNGTGRTLTAYNATSSLGLAAFVNDIASRYPAIRVDLRGASSGSDHAPFAYRRVPVAFLHTGLSATYHSVTDTPDTLDYPGIVTTTAFAFETAWRATYTSDLRSLGQGTEGMVAPSGLDHDVSPFFRLGP